MISQCQKTWVSESSEPQFKYNLDTKRLYSSTAHLKQCSSVGGQCKHRDEILINNKEGKYNK